MDYSNLTKEQIIQHIKKNVTHFLNLSKEQRDDKEVVLEAVKKNGYALEHASDKLRDDKDVVLEAVKQNGITLVYASKRLQNEIDCLEILEREQPCFYNPDYKKWYEERMEVLASIRRQEDKELMENSITTNNIQSKKVKF